MLVRIALFVFVGLVAYFALRRFLAKFSSQETAMPGANHGVSQLVQDPQCGVYIDRSNAVARKVPNGFLFFCSQKCADEHMSS